MCCLVASETHMAVCLHGGYTLTVVGTGEYKVKMRGLPFRASTYEVEQFFNGYQAATPNPNPNAVEQSVVIRPS